MNNRRKSFRVCEKCGKKLIERLPNGIWCFQFGRKPNKEGDEDYDDYCPVEIYIHGSIKIKCLSRACNHMNIFHYFPNFRKVPQSPRKANDNRQVADNKPRSVTA